MKKMITLLLILSIFTIAGCKKNDAPDPYINEIQKRGILRIGTFDDMPPFCYKDENGEFHGLDVYIGKRFAKDLLGDESAVEFIPLLAAERSDALIKGAVDIVIANYTVTEERKQLVNFAMPYMKVSLGVVSPSYTPLNSINEIVNKNLIVIKGTTAETYFKLNHPEIELMVFETNFQAFDAIKQRKGAGLAHDNLQLFAWAIDNPGFIVSIPSIGPLEIIAPAVNKDNVGFLNWVNEEIIRLGKENFMHKAYDETLRNYYGNTIQPEEIIIEGGKI